MKLSRNMKTSSTFVKRTDSNWEPRCLHCSLSTGDLIVGMHSKNTDSGKVIRYNREGQPIGTIHLDNTGLELYKKPNFITENNNGDIVVSDSWSAVVVTEGGGGWRRVSFHLYRTSGSIKFITTWNLHRRAFTHIGVWLCECNSAYAWQERSFCVTYSKCNTRVTYSKCNRRDVSSPQFELWY